MIHEVSTLHYAKVSNDSQGFHSPLCQGESPGDCTAHTIRHKNHTKYLCTPLCDRGVPQPTPQSQDSQSQDAWFLQSRAIQELLSTATPARKLYSDPHLVMLVGTREKTICPQSRVNWATCWLISPRHTASRECGFLHLTNIKQMCTVYYNFYSLYSQKQYFLH